MPRDPYEEIMQGTVPADATSTDIPDPFAHDQYLLPMPEEPLWEDDKRMIIQNIPEPFRSFALERHMPYHEALAMIQPPKFEFDVPQTGAIRGAKNVAKLIAKGDDIAGGLYDFGRGGAKISHTGRKQAENVQAVRDQLRRQYEMEADIERIAAESDPNSAVGRSFRFMMENLKKRGYGK